MLQQNAFQNEKSGPCPHVGYRLSALKSSHSEGATVHRSLTHGSLSDTRCNTGSIRQHESSRSYNCESATRVTHPLTILERILQAGCFDPHIDIPPKSSPHHESLEFEQFSLISPTRYLKGNSGSSLSFKDVHHGTVFSPRSKIQRQQEILATEALIKEMFKEKDRHFFWLDDLKRWVPREGFDENWEYFSFVKGADLIARYSALTGKNLEHLQHSLQERSKLLDQHKLERLKRIKEHKIEENYFKAKPRPAFTAPVYRDTLPKTQPKEECLPTPKPPMKPKEVIPIPKPPSSAAQTTQKSSLSQERMPEILKNDTNSSSRRVTFETKRESTKQVGVKAYQRTEEFTTRRSTSVIFKKSANRNVRDKSSDSVRKPPRSTSSKQSKLEKPPPPENKKIYVKTEKPTSPIPIVEDIIDSAEISLPNTNNEPILNDLTMTKKRQPVEKKQRVSPPPKKQTVIPEVPVVPQPEPEPIEEPAPVEEPIIPSIPEVKLIEIPQLPDLPTLQPKPTATTEPLKMKKLKPLMSTSPAEIEESNETTKLERKPTGGFLLALRRQQLEDELRAKYRLKRRQSESSEISKDHPNFDDYDFLARYTVLTEDKIEKAKHIYFSICSEEMPWLSMNQTLEALHKSNPNLRETDKEYLCRILQIFNYHIENGADFRLFAVLSSFAEKISVLDEWMRRAITQVDYKLLEMRSSLCRSLWEVNVDHESNTIPLQQLCVELVAGGVSEEHVKNVCRKLGWMYALDLLDFLTYIPLFITLHNSILSNPLDDSREL